WRGCARWRKRCTRRAAAGRGCGARWVAGSGARA
ncbi:MAG: hypothetical protein AVDCRST_MAG89-1670, partial [uncultured Gemmatimonadetes bacterium]